jgi:hydroxymethylbilane synthase
MEKTIRIGTRDSELALWQANKVKKQLEELGYTTSIVPIKSTGDIILDKPLYELGITGIFTKNLDVAMLRGDIDIAVHSMKDVPTVLPEGIIQAAVLKRANHNDILIVKDTEEFMGQKEGVIATGSLRRKAQWLDRYPTHRVVDLRGNVNTRLEKLDTNEWNGAVFAAAGLERIGKRPKGAISLSWMIPAPAQGAIMITALEADDYAKDACEQINDRDTQTCTGIEREFLNRLEGGCTAPIGALAYINEVEKEIHFKGVLLRRDGSKKIEISKKVPLGRHKFLAKDCANYIIERGGKLLMLEDEGIEKKFSIYSTKKLSEGQKKILPSTVQVTDSDFIKIRYNRIAPKVIKKELSNVVITSKNGVEAILHNFTKEELQFKNIYCVGRRTKKLIEEKIGKVTHTEKNAAKLATYLLTTLQEEEVTYFCSNLRLDTLSSILKDKGIKVQEVESYKTMYSPVKIEDKIDIILFYSPSGVESYIEKNQTNTNTIAFCIGNTTANEAKKYFQEVQIAKMPTVDSVLELVKAHYNKES